MSSDGKRHQWVQPPPDGEFAETLRCMHATNDPRLNATLRAAQSAGWEMRSLGMVLRMSRQAVHQRIGRATYVPFRDLPVIPPAPKAPQYQPHPRRRLTLDAEMAGKLRTMYATARTVNGGMARWHPARRVSEEFTAQLASLVDQGVSMNHLADVLGCTFDAVAFRLSRHGYRKMSPSQRWVYRNRKTGDDTNHEGARQ
jgi:hypothetical protein